MKQISVFIENKKGKLAEVTSVLAENKINLRALSIADTADFGILRVIADDTEKAESVLKESGFLFKINTVIGVTIEDQPGSLNKIISALSLAGVSVEYTYAFTSSTKGSAYMVFRVDDREKALNALKDANIQASV